MWLVWKTVWDWRLYLLDTYITPTTTRNDDESPNRIPVIVKFVALTQQTDVLLYQPPQRINETAYLRAVREMKYVSIELRHRAKRVRVSVLRLSLLGQP